MKPCKLYCLHVLYTCHVMSCHVTNCFIHSIKISCDFLANDHMNLSSLKGFINSALPELSYVLLTCDASSYEGARLQ